MKRIISLVSVALLGMTLAACSGSSTDSPAAPSGQSQGDGAAQEQSADGGAAQVTDQSSPEEIIAAIQADFSATQQGLLDKQASVYE